MTVETSGSNTGDTAGAGDGWAVAQQDVYNPGVLHRDGTRPIRVLEGKAATRIERAGRGERLRDGGNAGGTARQGAAGGPGRPAAASPARRSAMARPPRRAG